MDSRILKMKDEMEQHLKEKIIPFWEGLKDEENGGFYGYMDFDSLEIDKKYVKGCILHSRILWFFSNAYLVLKDEKFLDELRNRLSGLPQEDIEERIAFYEEMIDDRMEDGVSEEEAVSRIGSVENIARQIMSEIPLTKLVQEKVKPKRNLRAWEIVLLVLGSPLWISLLISVLAIIFSVYVTIWSVVLVVYAFESQLGRV